VKAEETREVGKGVAVGSDQRRRGGDVRKKGHKINETGVTGGWSYVEKEGGCLGEDLPRTGIEKQGNGEVGYFCWGSSLPQKKNTLFP